MTVLLVLDYSPSGLNTDILKHGNGMFKIIFLPLNITSISQPMDQSTIETVKLAVQETVLRKILLDKVNHPTTMQIDMKECCMMVADAWNLVKVSTLKILEQDFKLDIYA